MKRNVRLRKNNLLNLISVLLLFCFLSCGLSELAETKHVSVKAHPKIVIPLAYGTIDIKTLFQYVNPGDEEFPPDENGYYQFENIIPNVSIPDTIAFNGSLFEKFTSVELRIETNNKLPLGFDFEFNFVDTLTFEILGMPITCHFLKPAVIDNEGKATAATHNIENFIIAETQIPYYINANAILMLIHVYLPESESDTIFLHKDDFLSLNVGMAIQLSTEEFQ